jgi:hypothetical protein
MSDGRPGDSNNKIVAGIARPPNRPSTTEGLFTVQSMAAFLFALVSIRYKQIRAKRTQNEGVHAFIGELQMPEQDKLLALISESPLFSDEARVSAKNQLLTNRAFQELWTEAVLESNAAGFRVTPLGR